jgi:hypothetical protein
LLPEADLQATEFGGVFALVTALFEIVLRAIYLSRLREEEKYAGYRWETTAAR